MIGKGLSTAINNILYTERGRFILAIILGLGLDQSSLPSEIINLLPLDSAAEVAEEGAGAEAEAAEEAEEKEVIIHIEDCSAQDLLYSLSYHPSAEGSDKFNFQFTDNSALETIKN